MLDWPPQLFSAPQFQHRKSERFSVLGKVIRTFDRPELVVGEDQGFLKGQVEVVKKMKRTSSRLSIHLRSRVVLPVPTPPVKTIKPWRSRIP
jgi:hypothetical protein